MFTAHPVDQIFIRMRGHESKRMSRIFSFRCTNSVRPFRFSIVEISRAKVARVLSRLFAAIHAPPPTISRKKSIMSLSLNYLHVQICDHGHRYDIKSERRALNNPSTFIKRLLLLYRAPLAPPKSWNLRETFVRFFSFFFFNCVYAWFISIFVFFFFSDKIVIAWNSSLTAFVYFSRVHLRARQTFYLWLFEKFIG